MSIWARAAERLNTSLDRVYGELVDIARPAPERLVAGGAAIIRLSGVVACISESEEQLGTVRGRDGFNLEVVAGEVIATFDRTRFASPSDWPRVDELVLAHDRPVSAIFKVVSPPVLDDGDRLNCRVVKQS